MLYEKVFKKRPENKASKPFWAYTQTQTHNPHSRNKEGRGISNEILIPKEEETDTKTACSLPKGLSKKREYRKTNLGNLKFKVKIPKKSDHFQWDEWNVLDEMRTIFVPIPP